MGVVVRRHMDFLIILLLILTPLVLALFLQQHPYNLKLNKEVYYHYTFCSVLKLFFVLFAIQS